MRYIQGSVAATLHRVQSFLRKYADRLGGLATSGASTKIDASAALLDASAREQECQTLAARIATVECNAARHALLTQHLYPIAHVAAAELENGDALSVFRMPRAGVDAKTLIEKARAMESAAVAHEAAFSNSLASADFAADLRSAVETFTQALEERAGAVAGRENATAALAVETRIARKRLRVISRFVMAAIENDPSLVAEWNAVKRIDKAPARSTSSPDGDAAPARQRRHLNPEAE